MLKLTFRHNCGAPVKAKERKCEKCGEIKVTFSSSPVCANCVVIEKNAANRAKEYQLFEDLGYRNIRQAENSAHGKTQWTFIHECGIEQTWVFGNFQTRLKADPNNLPCSSCGGKRRMQKAIDGYVEKHGRKYNLKDFEDYRQKVRTLTEKTYNHNRELINPENHKRMLGNQGHHLDHIIPIITCFHNGVSVVGASSLKNLRIITAYDNIAKGRWGTDDNLMQELMEAV